MEMFTDGKKKVINITKMIFEDFFIEDYFMTALQLSGIKVPREQRYSPGYFCRDSCQGILFSVHAIPGLLCC